MDSFSGFLNEMIIHTLDENPNVVIAFRGDIWLLNYSEEDHPEIYEKIISNHPYKKELEGTYKGYITSWVDEYIQDAVVGYWDKKKRIFHLRSELDAISSPLVKKVAQALKVRSVTRELPMGEEGEEVLYKTTRKQMVGNFPDNVYHGTSSTYLWSILRIGLKPGQSASNYADQGIDHPHLLFFSVSRPEAESHAFHTARLAKGKPILLNVRIPDKNLIVPDYDVDSMAGQTTYNHNRSPSSFFSVGSYKASKHSGLFGYEGRVPASLINSIEVFTSDHRQYPDLTQKWIKLPKNRNRWDLFDV